MKRQIPDVLIALDNTMLSVVRWLLVWVSSAPPGLALLTFQGTVYSHDIHLSAHYISPLSLSVRPEP